MSDWKKDLENKLEKEVTNVVNISSSANSSGSRIHRISDIKEKGNSLTIKKEEHKVITVEGALSDLDKLIAEAQGRPEVFILSGMKVMVKFLSTMRSNQLLTDEDKKAIKAKKVTREVKAE